MKRFSALLCIATVGAGVCLPQVQAADTTSAAELAFNNHCRECHMVDKDDNRVGPTLCGIIGRKAGSVASYSNYSAAIQDSGITWDAASLNKWMTDPNAFLPGNNMNPFPGVEVPEQRALIISYLSTTACK